MARTRLKKKKKKEVWEKQCRPILEKYVQSTQHKKEAKFGRRFAGSQLANYYL